MALEISRNPTTKPVISPQNEWGDKNTLNLALSVKDTDQYQVISSNIQGFVGNKEAIITEHQEDPGVIEIFFPLSGQIQMTRGDESVVLSGSFNNLLNIQNKGELVLENNIDNPILQLKTNSGDEINIQGFIISEKTKHSTTMIPVPGQVCRYVSVKLTKTPSI